MLMISGYGGYFIAKLGVQSEAGEEELENREWDHGFWLRGAVRGFYGEIISVQAQ